MAGMDAHDGAATGAAFSGPKPAIADMVRDSAVVLPGGKVEIGALHRKIDCGLLNDAVDRFTERFGPRTPNVVLAPDGSGVILGALAASKLGARLIVARKEIGLHEAVIRRSAFCSRQHATRELRIYRSDLGPGDRVLVVDDVMCRGDSIAALAEITRETGARLVGIGVMVELRCDARPKLISADINPADIVSVVRLCLNGKRLEVA